MVTNMITESIELLKDLISIESFSFNEFKTAERIEKWFQFYEIKYSRVKNNVFAKNKYFDDSKPTILLNSHHDTVKPNDGYTNNPFESKVKDGKLYGLGSNDAGGALVSLISVFTLVIPLTLGGNVPSRDRMSNTIDLLQGSREPRS